MKTKGLKLGLLVLVLCFVACSHEESPVPAKKPTITQDAHGFVHNPLCTGSGYFLCVTTGNLTISYEPAQPPTGPFGAAATSGNKVFFDVWREMYAHGASFRTGVLVGRVSDFYPPIKQTPFPRTRFVSCK
jgi:hypothetical protein